METGRYNIGGVNWKRESFFGKRGLTYLRKSDKSNPYGIQ